MMSWRFIGNRKPHKRPGTSARQERRKAARERLASDIATVLTFPLHHVSERDSARLARMRAEYAILGRKLGIMDGITETVNA